MVFVTLPLDGMAILFPDRILAIGVIFHSRLGQGHEGAQADDPQAAGDVKGLGVSPWRTTN